MLIAETGVKGTSFVFDMPYSYTVPDEFRERIVPGIRVIVPFGRGNRRRLAVVLRVYEGEEKGLKEISAPAEAEPVINSEQLELISRLHDTVFCTYYEALSAVIPPGLGITFSAKYRLLGKKPENGDLSKAAAELLASAYEARDGEADTILGSDPKSAAELVSGGFIAEIDNTRQRIRDDTVLMVRMSADPPENIRLTPKQTAAADILTAEGCASVKELCYLCGCTSAVIKNMVRAGVAEFFEDENLKAPDIAEREDISLITLTPPQQSVYDGLAALVTEKKAAAALLFGVTGSGKTPIFAKLIRHTVSMGRGVIMLIPEIALTPQILNRFRRLFGETVAVMHSGLSLSARSNEYKRIKSGLCRIVVGTRSAVFAPLDNIGLIVMDEEGERSYKSDRNPRYSAKDIAAQRCAKHNALLLCASATPSVESFYSALSGKMKLFRLSERYSPSANSPPSMPKVKIIDMAGSNRFICSELACEIEDNLQKGEQSILLLNRRGYRTYIYCPQCKKPLSCPQCSIPMTYHKVNGQLICHYCGHTEDYTKLCPVCRSNGLRELGLGTQTLEEELKGLFPKARVLRMDADTTYSRYAYDKRFSAFGRGEYDIMAGTQMIAKGLDFPKVTLVGALNVDKALYAGDFRSYERTFSLITQVVGRSGRMGGRGRAYIQTYAPDHYVINLAARQDYEAFYNEEIASRKAMLYPPFCDICCLIFSGTEDTKTTEAARLFAQTMAEEREKISGKMPMQVLGPSKCELEKIGGKYRHRIIIKCKNNALFREYIGTVRRITAALPQMRGIAVSIDINGDLN